MISMLTTGSMTATEMARELDLSHASASYHLRQLEQAGLVESNEGAIIHGGRERRYRQRVHDQYSPRATWNESDVRMVIEALHTDLGRRAASLAPGSNAVIDGECWVPLEIWEQARAQIRAAGQLLQDAAQPPKTVGTSHVSITALLFQMIDENDKGNGR
jgi:DNA-binding transcriptional ArsR family regulator